MRGHIVLTFGLSVLSFVIPGVALGAFYDAYDDGQVHQDANDPNIFDPNLWDIDNPHWTIHELMGDPASFYYDANDGWLRMYAYPILVQFAFMGASVDDGDPDPNSTETIVDDSSPHYVLARVKVPDPNWGGISLFLLSSPATWTGYNIDYQANNHVFEINRVDATDWARGDYVVRDGMDEPNGFWICLQYDGQGDPNTSDIRASCWNGDKYDWGGAWDISVNIAAGWDLVKYPHLTEGGTALGSYGSQVTGLTADTKFDDIEFRRGLFTRVSRTLTVKLKDCCELGIEPNLAHPDGGEKRRYTNGTAVVLDAVVPCGNKVFKKWTVKGPNDAGDPLYQIVTDTNEVVYLTMDGDYLVKATCKCGGGVEPFAGMVLVVLGVGVVIRRLT